MPLSLDETFDWICLNEEEDLECDYPFCDCEASYYGDYLKDLPDIFADLESGFSIESEEGLL